MTKSEKVTTICYGKKTEWHSFQLPGQRNVASFMFQPL